MWKKEDDWFWEGNVQEKISSHLQKQGFEVRAVNTAKKSAGADIIGRKSGENIVVEVKGWPSDKYTNGAKRGEPKPTQPSLQAKHWLSEALLAIIRRKQEYPEHTLAIGLPDFKRYVDLINDIKWATEKLKIKIFIVEASGRVVES